MGLTIEELYSFKEKYENEIKELERKKSVVDEFILFAEAKHIAEVQEETYEAEETFLEEQPQED